MSEQLETIGEKMHRALNLKHEEIRRELEAEAAHLLTDATPIRFTLSDEGRTAREVPRPQIERHLTQFEIDSRPPKLNRRVLTQLRRRFISRALLRVDSY